ncbi:Lsr2 dimerization domain-containing protein, partial [Terrabacter aerolatus]
SASNRRQTGTAHTGSSALAAPCSPLTHCPYDHAMAQQKIVTLIDDLDGTEAAETVTFAIDGGIYEIDLSAKKRPRLGQL